MTAAGLPVPACESKNEATNNPCGPAAGIGGSVCVNRLRPVEAVGGGMSDFWKDNSNYRYDPPVAEPVAQAWAEGYRAGIDDERTSEANIGIAGMGMKVEPARNNPYHTTPPAAQRHWAVLMRGVRVEGDTVIITVKGGNDEARCLCGELINEMEMRA
jgi:hypothetical protein